MALALALVAALLVSACGSDTKGSTAAATPSMYEGLCAALASAASGDTAKAATVFDDTVHGPVHELAAAAERVDRASAARLLEAKQAVESDLESRAPGPQLADHLGALAHRVRAAIVVTGKPEPAKCSKETR